MHSEREHLSHAFQSMSEASATLRFVRPASEAGERSRVLFLKHLKEAWDTFQMAQEEERTQRRAQLEKIGRMMDEGAFYPSTSKSPRPLTLLHDALERAGLTVMLGNLQCGLYDFSEA